LNKREKVNYAVGIMSNGRNQDNAARYLAYLATDEAQAIYEKYGFIRASTEELTLNPL
jgi:molybdate transport system substrate-binding protein